MKISFLESTVKKRDFEDNNGNSYSENSRQHDRYKVTLDKKQYEKHKEDVFSDSNVDNDRGDDSKSLPSDYDDVKQNNMELKAKLEAEQQVKSKLEAEQQAKSKLEAEFKQYKTKQQKNNNHNLQSSKSEQESKSFFNDENTQKTENDDRHISDVIDVDVKKHIVTVNRDEIDSFYDKYNKKFRSQIHFNKVITSVVQWFEKNDSAYGLRLKLINEQGLSQHISQMIIKKNLDTLFNIKKV